MGDSECFVSFWDVVNPVLTHCLQSNYLDALDVCALLCTCKEAKTLIRWDDIREIFRESQPSYQWIQTPHSCSKCGCDAEEKGLVLLPGPKDLCMHCQGVIVPSQACYVYHLSPHDFKHIPRMLVATTERMSTAVSLRVILNIALVKHDGPAALKQKMLPKEHDLPEHKARMHRVLEMIDKLQPSSELKLKWTCQPLPRQVTKYFSRERTDYQEDDAKRAIQRMLDYEVQLQNMPESRKSIAARNDCRRLFINTEISKQTGYGSFNYFVVEIEKQTRALSGNKELWEVIAPIEADYLDDLISRSNTFSGKPTIPELLTFLRPYSQKAMRKQQLVTELTKRGLRLRSDSRLCRAFIAGTFTDLNEVCDMMLEMAWLAKNTRYQQEFARLLQERKELKSLAPGSGAPIWKLDIETSKAAKRSVVQNELIPRYRSRDLPEIVRNRLAQYQGCKEWN